MLADLRNEHAARYRSFRERFGHILPPDFSIDLDGRVFVDFVAESQPRVIPSRPPLCVRRRRDRRGLTLDYRRTLRPFFEKLQGRAIEPDRIERFFTNRLALGAFTAVCALAAAVSFASGFWLGSGSAGGAVFFLALVPGTLAYWGVWNLCRQYRSTRGLHDPCGPRE